MTLAIRQAHLERDRADLLSFFRVNFADWRDDSKFDWLYFDNPAGRARAWILHDRDRVIGVSTAFPRKLRLGARVMKAWVLGDFCIAKDQRSLGPALALQRATCEAVDRGDVDLFYDFPSRTMVAIYSRLGVRPAGEMIRMVHPIRVDRLVEKRIGRPVLARALSAAVNLWLRGRQALRRRDASIELRPYVGELTGNIEGPEMDGGVAVDRSAEYLNWRYRSDPRGPFSVLEADGGFVVVSRAEDQLVIEDAFGAGSLSLLRQMVLEVIAIARREGRASVAVGISTRHPWAQMLGELGFHRREGVPFVVYARPDVLAHDTPWYLMRSDRDS